MRYHNINIKYRMGNCLNCCSSDEIKSINVALKFPNGLSGITYNEKNEGFDKCESIDDWIQSLYKQSNWSNYLVYNDETKHIEHKSYKKGHCKGIVAWNENKISWFIHSVPNFPREFDGKNISPIEKNEHIYGQSFVYMECENNGALTQSIVEKLHLMDAHIYLTKCNIDKNVFIKETVESRQFHEVVLSPVITHISKSHLHHKDIYSECLTSKDKMWYVETWKRGLKIKETTNVAEVSVLCWQKTLWKETQDHSKWAVSDSYVWIGDLNRMESQYKRGGGGLLIKNKSLVKAFRSLIIF